ncbi:MAG: hypothetical protein OEV49_00215 [candidate division Zixibacteria bacterium]|nr:hypothetical protein [candidate division Zixibacteria bacterium]MDH3936511.1 hypothetical protein [candidate division Zixibacteria bacterium]MDH4033462.1 hypothetical protein [candidate division Zixibacteria bacterium]
MRRKSHSTVIWFCLLAVFLACGAPFFGTPSIAFADGTTGDPPIEPPEPPPGPPAPPDTTATEDPNEASTYETTFMDLAYSLITAIL